MSSIKHLHIEKSYLLPYFYRYAFQGQERDDEVKGAGNSYNYKYRMHDSRLGRFFAVDPLHSKYPYYSTYAFSGNRVIDAVELEGLEPSWFNYFNPLTFVYQLNADFSDAIVGDESWGGEFFGFFADQSSGKNFTKSAVEVIKDPIPLIEDTYMFVLTLGTSEAIKLFNGVVADGEAAINGDGEAAARLVSLSALTFMGVRELKPLTVKPKGSLKISAKEPSISELNSANFLKEQGYNVELRDPKLNSKRGNETSDLVVDGMDYDVYTPKTGSVKRIISAIAKKSNQASGVVLDLSRSTAKPSDFKNALKRVNNAGATNIVDIQIFDNKSN